MLSFQGLITAAFDPTDEYVAGCMRLDSVQKFMFDSKFRVPVFLTTGLNIGRGCSLLSNSSLAKGWQMQGGFMASGAPMAPSGHVLGGWWAR